MQFIGVRVVGSNNGFEAQDPAGATEFFARDKANVAWIDDGFRQAQETSARAVVIFMQAEFNQARFPNGAMPRQSGFTSMLDAIERGARDFGNPVLIVNGDEHFVELKPMRNSRGHPERAEADGLRRARRARRTRDRRPGLARACSASCR